MMVLNSIINGNPEIESHILGIPNVNRGYQPLLQQPDDQPACFPCPARRCPCCIENSRMIIYFCSLPSGQSKLNSSFSLIFLDQMSSSPISAEPNTMFTSREGFLSLTTLQTDGLVWQNCVFRVILLERRLDVELLQNIPTGTKYDKIVSRQSWRWWRTRVPV